MGEKMESGKTRRLALLFLFGVFFISFAYASGIEDVWHVGIQTTYDNGTIQNGTFDMIFNISTSEDCSNIVYNKDVEITTNPNGRVSHYLNVTDYNLTYDQQYWLCYYREGDLKNSSKVAPASYANYATNTTWLGVDGRPTALTDFDNDLVGRTFWYNHTADVFTQWNSTWDNRGLIGLNHTLEVFTQWGQWFYNHTDYNFTLETFTNWGQWWYNQTEYNFTLITFDTYNSTWDQSYWAYNQTDYNFTDEVVKNYGEWFYNQSLDYNYTQIIFDQYNSTWDNRGLIGVNHTLEVFTQWGEWFYNHTNYNFTLEVFNNYNATWDNRGLIAGINVTWNESHADTQYASIIWGYNHTDYNFTQEVVTNYGQWFYNQTLGYNYTDEVVKNYALGNNTKMFHDLFLNRSGAINYSLEYNFTKEVVDNYGQWFYNHTDYNFTDEVVKNYALGNNTKIYHDLFLNRSGATNYTLETFTQWGDFFYNQTLGYNYTNEVVSNYNASWDNRYLLWDAAFNASFDQRDQTGSGNASWNESHADTQYAAIGWGYNQTLGYNYTSITFDTYNATWDQRMFGIFNHTLEVFTQWGQFFYNQTLAYNYTSITFDTYNSTWDNKGLVGQVNLTSNIQRLINDTTYNATSFAVAENITALDCILFNSGGKICSGS